MNFLHLFFHNFSLYDWHHILKNSKLEKGETHSAIARSDDTITSIILEVPVGSYTDKKNKIVRLFHSIQFLDKLEFMSQSLESLAKTFNAENVALFCPQFPSEPEQVFEKPIKKFFPYSFLDNFQTFEEPLPPLGIGCKNTLTGPMGKIPDKYNEGVCIYEVFACKNLGDYHDL